MKWRRHPANRSIVFETCTDVKQIEHDALLQIVFEKFVDEFEISLSTIHPVTISSNDTQSRFRIKHTMLIHNQRSDMCLAHIPLLWILVLHDVGTMFDIACENANSDS